ncbi:MAG: hypothetical protein P8N02_09465 [Actinomycetota bacterium]|nr:hypothetical protein [Actinomycetota bacterium]
MANLPLELEARRRRSWLAALLAGVMVVVDPSPLGELLGPLDPVGRALAVAHTSTGTFSIDAAGVVEELGLEPVHGDPSGGTVEALCDSPCTRYLVRPADGGSWTATFGSPVDVDAPTPAVANDGQAVAALVAGDGALHLEIARASGVLVVPFSNEGSGHPVVTAWAPRGDGLVYARSGESRLQVFSPESWATGSVWLDEAVLAAAVLLVC